LLEGGELLSQPGLVAALELLRDEGAATFYEGTIARLMLDLLSERGANMTQQDLREYAVQRPEPQQVRVGEGTVTGRRSLGHTLDTLAALPDLKGTTDAERAIAFARLLAGRRGRLGDTSNVSVVDGDGNACVVTTSLGLGSSDWLPGLDIHLNSMLGEHDLISGPLIPGERVGSMMCPSICLDANGLVAAAGAAGGSRIRSAMVQVLSGVLLEEIAIDEAVRRPRLHVDGTVVHLEPDYPVDAAEALRAEGWVTRVWRSKHHFFGGVSVVSRRGACGEPRRDGAALLLDTP
jgi:gamma-glutamyltranspeptidase/glutathione hydrolase